MADMTNVDGDLEARLLRYADAGVRPFDDRAARAAIASSRPRSVPAGALSAAAVWALIAALCILALAAVAQRHPTSSVRPLVFVPRLGGIVLASETGADRIEIASDGRYGDPRWSPDGRWIAVGHDPLGAAAARPRVHPIPSDVLPIPDGELLVLTVDGRVVSRFADPISSAWAPAGSGEPRLAIASAAGVAVVRPDGSAIDRWPASQFPNGVTSLDWLPRPRDRSAALLVAAPDGVWILDGDTPPARIERSWPGAVLSIEADRAGERIVVATDGCSGSCKTTIDVVDLRHPSTSLVSSTSKLSIRPTFTLDGSAILAWPSVVPLDGGQPYAATLDRRIGDYDVGATWTRTAGSYGILFFHEYPGWNDRRWDAHLVVTPVTPPFGIARDITGVDLLER